jgi:hypothetical protein
MKSTKLLFGVFAIVSLITVTSSPLAYAVPAPLHAYTFSGDYLDSGTGGVSITAEGGTVGSSLHEMDPQLPPGNFNHGLTLHNAGLSDFGVYTIEMYMKFDSVVSISGDYWLKLIDFRNASESLGVYYVDGFFPGNNPAPGESSVIRHAYGPFPGRPDFVDSPTTVMTGGDWVHFATTRDAAGQVTGFINGLEVYSYDDSTHQDAVFFHATTNPTNIMRFLQGDNPATGDGYYEVGKGAIDFLNIYDSALSETDIATLASAVVPEPASMTLMGLSSLLLLFRRR